MTLQTDDLSILKSSSLTSALEKELERLITEGELVPGERLNEIHLAARFGTSRGPLREATRSLEAKGYVEVIRNRGVFVRELDIDEALEIYEIRGALFGLAGRLVAQKMTDELLARLSDLVQEMGHYAEAADFDKYYPLNLEFHRTIVEASGNRALISEYRRLVKTMHLFRAKGLVQGGGLAVSNREHMEMLNALASGDADRAQAAHWRHVDRAKHRMLIAMKKGDAG
jgi:DNA-binding GntR family transcriptional regulator